MRKRISNLFCVACLGLSVFLTGCSNLLYYPTRNLYVDPRKLPVEPLAVKLQVKDGALVHGWYFRPAGGAPPRARIIFFHGNGQNRSAHFLTLFWLVEKGFELVIFDYPGYGQSGGDPSPESTVATAREVLLRYASPHIPVVVYGQSLGGAIALRALYEVRHEVWPDLVVIDSSFSSYQSAARSVMAQSAWTWALQPFAFVLFSDRWAPAGRLGHLRAKRFVVIHSAGDEVIPVGLGRRVHEQLPEPKEIWIKSKGRHNNTFEDPEGLKLKARLLALLP